MKRWALVVAGLYALVLVVLTLPVVVAAFAPEGLGGASSPWGNGDQSFAGIVKESLTLYLAWEYWVLIACVALCQFALLALPVRVANRRPVSRGALWPTVLAGGLMFGLLFGGACFSITEWVSGGAALDDPLYARMAWSALAAVLLMWTAWSLLFLRFARASEPRDLIGRQFRWLFRGSVLELLIAVPAHVVARHRDYCCAGGLTFLGLSTGIAVMLFAFGPSVFFLYAERWRRLHPQAAPPTGEGT